jgi:hypothetical protein
MATGTIVVNQQVCGCDLIAPDVIEEHPEMMGPLGKVL